MQLSRLLFGARKLPYLTSKRGNKNYYKGRGAPLAGAHTSRGGFKVDPQKVATFTFIAPDLTGFKLKAYVSRETPQRSKAVTDAVDVTEADATEADTKSS